MENDLIRMLLIIIPTALLIVSYVFKLIETNKNKKTCIKNTGDSEIDDSHNDLKRKSGLNKIFIFIGIILLFIICFPIETSNYEIRNAQLPTLPALSTLPNLPINSSLETKSTMTPFEMEKEIIQLSNRIDEIEHQLGYAIKSESFVGINSPSKFEEKYEVLNDRLEALENTFQSNQNNFGSTLLLQEKIENIKENNKERFDYLNNSIDKLNNNLNGIVIALGLGFISIAASNFIKKK